MNISTGTRLGHSRAPFSWLFVCGGGVLPQGPKGELSWTFVPEVTLKEVCAGYDGPRCSPAVEPHSSLREMQTRSGGSSASSSSSSNLGVQRPLAAARWLCPFSEAVGLHFSNRSSLTAAARCWMDSQS